MKYNVEFNEQEQKFIGTVEGSDSSVVGDSELEVLEHLSEVAEEWVKYGKARHQAPEYKPHWVGKTPETDEVLQSALNPPKEEIKATEAKPKMKKKKVLEILAEYHHDDIVQLREELAVLKERISKNETEHEQPVNGKAEYNPLHDRTL